MSNRRRQIHLAVTALACLAAPVCAQTVTIEYLNGVMATDLSADGSVIVGNRQDTYEPFRWTEETGVEFLGRCSYEVLGVGAGGPKVSADGTRLSSTILGADSTYATQGVWTLGEGWTETMPPPPADGGIIDQSYGSGWGLSGNGQTLVGLYWRPGQPDGLAHASAWTADGGLVGLGSGGGNSRANAANYDGSVIVGWDEDPGFGTWWPTVWRDGVRTVLAQPDAFCLANSVTDDGSIIGGVTYEESQRSRVGALWHWNGSSYDVQILGVLEGSTPGDYAQAIVNGITPDGGMCVGYNQYSFNPGDASGFIWTPENGMVAVGDYLADHGIIVPADLYLTTITGVSDDGSVMVGIGQYYSPPFNNVTFIIRTTDPTGVPAAAAGLAVGAAYPNPFNPRTSIPVTLDRDAAVSVEIFDLAGRRVRTLHRGHLAAGDHVFAWHGVDDHGSAVPSGVYLARAGDGHGRTVARRLTLAK
jgi:uncharacterized membrane protein